MVAMLPLRMHVLSDVLQLGFVGTVCVHPYARGEGHMKHLMADLLADAKRRGLDLLVLGGQRYRVRKGDSFSYKPSEQHYLMNTGKTPATVLWVCTPPNF